MTGMTLFKLCQRASGATVLGLSCDEDGIFLSGEYALAKTVTSVSSVPSPAS